jgi:hypothetical protein
MFLLLLAFLWAVVHAKETVLNCSVVSQPMPSGTNFSINESCSSVHLQDLVVQGANVIVRINVTAQLRVAALTGASVGVLISNFALQRGAGLIIHGASSWAKMMTASTSLGPSVNISILNLTGQNGAVAFTGRFPPRTSILMSGASMVEDGNGPTLAFLFADKEFFGRSKLLAFVNVSLIETTSLLVARSSFSSTGRLPAPVVVEGPFEVAQNSQWVIERTVFDGLTQAMRVTVNRVVHFLFADVVVSDRSQWRMTHVFVNSIDIAIMIQASNISITGGSEWTIVNLTSNGTRGLELQESKVDVSSNSKWTLERSKVAGNDNGVALRSSVIQLSLGSAWLFTGVFLGSQYRAFEAKGCALTFASGSFWQIIDSHFQAEAGRSDSGFYLDNSELSLTRESSLLIHSSRFSGVVSGAVVFQSSVRLIARSEWRVEKSDFSSTTMSAFGAMSSNISIRDGSTMSFMSSSFAATLLPALAFSSLNVISGAVQDSWMVVEGSSALVIRSCDFASISSFGSVGFLKFRLVIRNHSHWTVDDCSIQNANGFSGGCALSMWDLSIHNSSRGEFTRSSFTASSSAALCFTSAVAVSRRSVLALEDCSVEGSVGAVLLSAPLRLDLQSVFLLAGLSLTTSKRGEGLTVGSAALVAGDSLMLLTRCALRVAGNLAACINLGQVTLGDFGSLRITDNRCVSADRDLPDHVGFLRGSVSVTESTRFPLVVERCNSVNDVAWRPAISTLDDIPGLISVPCGRCDVLVDCFVPLTDARLFSRIPCGDPPQCPCASTQCSEGKMCIPRTTSTEEPDVAACDVESVPHNGRLHSTQTISASATASDIATLSSTADVPTADFFRNLALRTAVSVGASITIVLAGPSGAAVMQRLHGQQRINRCGDADAETAAEVDFFSSPTRMVLGPRDDALAAVRGAALGNLLLWLACIVAAVAAVKIIELRCVVGSFREGMAELGLPGMLVSPFSMLMLPTLSAATSLLVAGDGAVSLCLALLAISVCFSAQICIVNVTTGHRFVAVARPSAAATAYSSGPRLSYPLRTLPRVKRYIASKLTNKWEWVDRSARSSPNLHHGFADRWGELFSAYVPKRQWFLSVEMAASSATAVLAGLVALAQEKPHLCSPIQLSSVFVDFAFFLAVVVLRPHGAPLEHQLAVGNAIVTAGSGLLGAAAYDTAILTAAQTLLNLLGAVLVGAVLVAEGKASAILDRAAALMTLVIDRRRRTRITGTASRQVGGGTPQHAEAEAAARRLGQALLRFPPRILPGDELAWALVPSLQEREQCLRDVTIVICHEQRHRVL